MDTNKLTKQINTMLQPRAALIAYSTNGDDRYFLELRSIDNEGNMIVEDSPSLMRSRRNKVVKERNKTWWTQMTQFPITARLTIKGLVRPTLIMDYLKLNVLFYGNKHISSGIYVITKQEDKIDASGYRTTLTLLRVKEDT
jgi:hypothetical protein